MLRWFPLQQYALLCIALHYLIMLPRVPSTAHAEAQSLSSVYLLLLLAAVASVGCINHNKKGCQPDAVTAVAALLGRRPCMAAGLAAGQKTPGRRSPMQNGKRSFFPKGSSLSGPLGHSRNGSSCGRTLRRAMPILFAAVLSSYITYLLLYPGRVSQHAGQQDGHPASHVGFHSSGSSSSSKTNQLHSGDSSRGSSASTGSSQAVLEGTHRYAPQDAAFQWVKAAGRCMRVALVNEAPYHLEIVAGLLQVLNTMPVDVTWYQAGQTTVDGTLTPTELIEVTGFTQLLGYLPQMKPDSATASPCDFAILVSPEYFLKETKVLVASTLVTIASTWQHSTAGHAQDELHYDCLCSQEAAMLDAMQARVQHVLVPALLLRKLLPDI